MPILVAADGGRECDACGEPVAKQSANEEQTADVFPESSDPAAEQAHGDSISNTFPEPAVADTLPEPEDAVVSSESLVLQESEAPEALRGMGQAEGGTV